MITPWMGLPPLAKSTDQFCDACLTDCTVCDATGKAPCRAYRCGGSGKVKDPGGVEIDCPVCVGTGKAKCTNCRGYGRVPTGTLNGSLDRKAKDCEKCFGRKFATQLVPQDWNTFLKGKIDRYTVIGPITSFSLLSVSNAPPLIFDVGPDVDGNYLCIILENPDEENSRGYFLGGTLRLR